MIRFIRPWRQFKPGDLDTKFGPGYGRGVCDALVRRHIAEWVTDNSPPQRIGPQAEMAVVGPPENASLPPVKRPRGRPRKYPRPEETP